MIKMYTVPFVVVLVHVHINCTCWLSSFQFKNLSTLFWYSKQVHFRLFLVILTIAPYTHLGDINITGCRKKSQILQDFLRQICGKSGWIRRKFGEFGANFAEKWLVENSLDIFCWKAIGLALTCWMFLT